MRQEEFQKIKESVKFLTEEQLSGLSRSILIEGVTRYSQNSLKIDSCMSEIEQCKMRQKVLSVFAPNKPKEPEESPKEDNLKQDCFNKLIEQGMRVEKGYRKGEFMKMVEKANFDEPNVELAVTALISIGVIVTSKGWYRFSDSAAGCVRQGKES